MCRCGRVVRGGLWQSSGVRFLDAPTEARRASLVRSITAAPGGADVLRGWRAEVRVEPERRDGFLGRVEEALKTLPPAGAVGRSIHESDQLLVAAPGEEVPGELANFGTAEKLVAMLRRCGLRSVSTADAPQFGEVLARRAATVVAALGERYRDRGDPRDLVWWADGVDLEGCEPEEVVQRVALDSAGAYAAGQHLVAARSSSQGVGPLSVPTVLDAAWHPAFHPAPPGSTSGWTRPYERRVEGVREWVGRPPPSKPIRLEFLGRLGA